MSQSEYLAGWDAARVQRLIEQHESQSDDELATEDDAAAGTSNGQTTITVPSELLPAIRRLLASHKATQTAGRGE